MSASGEAAAPRRDRLMLAFGIIGLAALWFLSRPYPGIAGDARIYVGRAVADLDPAGLGRQLDFLDDRQSLFTVFRPLMAEAVRLLGPSAAATTVAGIGLLSWLAAAAFLAFRLFKGRTAWAALACVIVFPLDYGGFWALHAAEAIATPRIFAEAAGLAALALLVDGRRLLAAAAWLVAMIIHPIMALPVGAVGFVMLVIEDRRWIWLGVAGALAVVTAAAVGAPVASRLVQVVDPAWRDLLQLSSPQMFPDLWPPQAWRLLGGQLAILALASRLLQPPFQRLALAAIGVVVAAIAIAAFAPGVLVLQAQLWRAQWLAAVLAGLAFAPCVVELVRALPASPWLGRPLALAVSFAALTPIATLAARRVLVAVREEALLPPNLLAPAWETWLADLLPVGVIAAAVAFGLWRLRGTSRRSRALVLAGVFALIAASACAWDRRSAPHRALEDGDAGRALRTVVRSGQVYWMGSLGNTWLWTGRPEWWSEIQSGGGAFDRELEVEWNRRFRILEHLGFATIEDVSLADVASPARPPRPVSVSAVRALCTVSGGPSWVVIPVSRADAGLAPLARMVWSDPMDRYQRSVFACADLVVPQPAPAAAPEPLFRRTTSRAKDERSWGADEHFGR